MEQQKNILIHGDNLPVMLDLEKVYTGQIKCIYIDPPYNTKNRLTHYNDRFDSSIWLNMMKERLVIMHRLLKEDGSIWISIDDNECHYLKVLCDEIFGRKNFIANVIWQKKYVPQNDSKWISATHDHIIVYAKEKKNWRPNLFPRSKALNSRYKNPDSDPRGPWMADNLTAGKPGGDTYYLIKDPITNRSYFPPTGRYWPYNRNTMLKKIKEKRVIFPKSKDGTPKLKRFLNEIKRTGLPSASLWLGSEVGDNIQAKKESKSLNDKDIFKTPKPERLIQRIIHLATNPGDLVLDSFAGSGTTGAVAHKMKRRWIMIEFADHCHTHIIPRMEKVISGEDQGGISEQVKWKGGGSFVFNDTPII